MTAQKARKRTKSFCKPRFLIMVAGFFMLSLMLTSSPIIASTSPSIKEPTPITPSPNRIKKQSQNIKIEKKQLSTQTPNTKLLENINLSHLKKQKSTKRKIPRNRVASLSFAWDHPVAAAIFRRSGYLWIIFDRHNTFDVDLLKEMGNNIVYDIKQIPHNGATAIRILAKDGYNASLRREGLLWIVDLMKKPQRPEQKLDILPQFNSPIGPHIFIPTKEAGTLTGLIDPEIGDALFIVPFMKIGIGAHPKYTFPEVDILPSSQGLVIRKKKSDIKIKVSKSGIEIFSDNGLILSEDLSSYQKNAGGSVMGGSKYFSLFRWKKNGKKDFLEAKKDLLQELYETKDNNLQEARMNLARFYIANSYAAETLGVLKNIATTKPDIQKTPKFLAIRAMANFLMGRYEQTVDDLNIEEFADSSSAAFWRAAAESEIAEPEKQAATLSANGAIIRDYPRKIKTKLALTAIKATIATTDDINTQTFLEIAKSDQNSENQKIAVKYYTSKWLELTGDYTNAIMKWNKIINKSHNRLYSALSAISRIKLLLKTNNISYAKAALELEKLRFTWRGNGFEFDSLGLLAKMYLADGRYSEGLRMLKHIHRNLDNFEVYSKETDQYITTIMKRVYYKLFLDGLSLKIPPIDAISLFNEFKYLVPEDKKGDEIILRMAGRMISVDLLNSAAELLEHQIKHRLKGEKKSRIGARLAVIQLMNRQPEQALNALDLSEDINLPINIEIQRKYLRAKAMAQTEMTDEAIELLADDFSIESRLLTTEILWNAKRWADASTVLRSFIKKPLTGETISDSQAKMILYWATALKLSGKEKILMRVRYNFLKHMKKTEFHDAFNLITGSTKEGILDPRRIAEEIEQVEHFYNFISNFAENKEYLTTK
ncbi:MAG: hypothetical protein GY804_05960 [Alphaproteobacteria bacterium]|nr:hypothetical protein [Alphaproteobacteria bacterium]